MKINELLHNFEIWASNEEVKLLEKLQHPIKLSNLNERDQYTVESLIRKSLVKKIGWADPSVMVNNKNEKN